jgi:tetratricopeptide (TPR) repeat protein
LAIDANFVPAAVTLADLYRGLGRDPEAEQVLRAIIARQPAAASAHFSLGLWLIRAARREEALSELKQAATLARSEPRFSYVYSVALAELGSQEQAIQLLRLTLQRHPYHRDSLLALAGFERDSGNIDAAISTASRLFELERDDASIGQFLAELRQRRN